MKIFFLVSVPEGYEKKLVSVLLNANAVSDQKNPIKIEGIYKAKEASNEQGKNADEK
jgi:hypothetical protein